MTRENKKMKPAEELANLIKANTKIIQIISYETLMIHGLVIGAAEELGRKVYTWDRIDGIKMWDENEKIFKIVESSNDNSLPDSPFLFFFGDDGNDEKENFILLMEDFHPNLADDQSKSIRHLRKAAMDDSNNNKKRTLILSQPFRLLPRELEKEVHIMELSHPSHEDLTVIFKRVRKNFGINDSTDPDHGLIDAALGLTIMEAEKAFSLAYIESGKLTTNEIPLIIREKESVIKKSGFLEYFHPKEEMKDVGGLDNLKDWLDKRGRAFDKGAKDYGLSYPRGIMLLGIPGTGKSLTAKAVGNLWRFPLLRLDMGKIFGGIVGESESNIRGALNIAEAIAPSILWIDEIEKAMSGLSSSGQTDGGTTARVLGTFLTWMQEKTKPVFVVATANNISQLPPELLRKGRVDEIFFTDLPTLNERKEIIKIHLRKKERKPDVFNIEELAKESQGFSGAELEEAIKEAMFNAFNKGREFRTEDILIAIQKTFPLARTMRETINDMRNWAKSRAAPASSSGSEELPKEWEKDKTPKLRQESYSNPFIKSTAESKG